MAAKQPLRQRSRIRIGRGVLGGRYISFTPQPGLRPTLGKVREAVLSMVAPYRESHGFVDLCAGSGILGFEAFSMGFRPVIWLDTAAIAVNDLRRNAEDLGVDGEVHRLDASRLADLGLESRRWILFGDPPYRDADFHGRTLHQLAALPAIETGSLYVAERGGRPDQWEAPGFFLVRHKTYGKTHVLVWKKGNLPADGRERGKD